MKTLYYTHPDFWLHDSGNGHPECPARLQAIEAMLSQPRFEDLLRPACPLGTIDQVQLIHPLAYIQQIRAAVPLQGLAYLDDDTVLSPGSETAALRAVGAACDAIDQLFNGQADNAFCAVRPPGHHAEPQQAMGFCLYNTIAIAAAYALQQYQLERIAIVDFDVHHGNGTQAAFYEQPAVLYASSHEMPLYPGTGFPKEIGAGNIINVPLHSRDTGLTVRQKYETLILPALEHFKPQLLLISAGFDAHRADPLASIQLEEADYRWLTQALLEVAAKHCQGRLVSVLEGGYHLQALATSVAAHVECLMGR